MFRSYSEINCLSRPSPTVETLRSSGLLVIQNSCIILRSFGFVFFALGYLCAIREMLECNSQLAPRAFALLLADPNPGASYRGHRVPEFAQENCLLSAPPVTLCRGRFRQTAGPRTAMDESQAVPGVGKCLSTRFVRVKGNRILAASDGLNLVIWSRSQGRP
jgi:hypothetical protein